MAVATSSRKPIGLRWRAHAAFILTTAAVGLFTDLFLYGLIVPVLPFLLEKEAGLPPHQIQAYTSAMLAAFAGATVVFSPLSGYIADKSSSRQGLFLFALVCLMGATVMLFLSRAIAVLVLARVLQGISCAFVWTIGLVICLDTVGADKMGRTLGTIFSLVQIGALWAPTIGGALYKRAGIRGVMGLAISLLAIDLLLRLLVIEKKSAVDTSSDNCSRVDSVNEGDYGGDREAEQEEQPLLDRKKEVDQAYKLSDKQPWIVHAVPYLACLSDPSLVTALLVSTVHGTLMGSFDATIATVSQSFFNFDSSQAGLLFLPIGVADLVFGPPIGWAVDRYGTKKPAVFAFGIMVPVLVLLRLVHPGGVQQVILYAVLLAIAGIGLAGCATPALVEGGNLIESYHRANPTFFGDKGPYAMVYGMNGAVFNAGLTVGPTLAGWLKETIGYGNMNLVMAGISGLTALLCLKYLGNKPRIQR